VVAEGGRFTRQNRHRSLPAIEARELGASIELRSTAALAMPRDRRRSPLIWKQSRTFPKY